MKDNTVVKTEGSTIRFIESTCDFTQFKNTYYLFDIPIKDISEIEWWEEHINMLGFNRALIQVEKHYVSGKIKVLGYNILTDKPVAREGVYGT